MPRDSVIPAGDSLAKDIVQSVTSPDQSIVNALAPGACLSRVRMPELDGIRGIAIAAVLAYHLFAYSIQLQGLEHSGLTRMLELISWPGFLGVDIFFVLSGFLITGILLDTKAEERFLRNFYARRALRILPLYFVVLVLIYCSYPRSGHFVLLSLFFLANMTTLFGIPMIFGPLWSLSVEEHFYLLWPWVVKITGARLFVAIALLICIAEPFVRIASLPLGQDGYFYSWTRSDGLAWGALIACFARSRKATRRTARTCMWGSVIVAGAVLLAGLPFGLLTRHRPLGAALLYAPAQFFSMALILSGLSMPVPGLTGLLRSRLLRLLGDLSYCLYLVHMLVIDAYDAVWRRFAPGLGSSGSLIARAVVVVILSGGLALLSRRFLERPALRLKRYLGAESPARRANVVQNTS